MASIQSRSESYLKVMIDLDAAIMRFGNRQFCWENLESVIFGTKLTQKS